MGTVSTALDKLQYKLKYTYTLFTVLLFPAFSLHQSDAIALIYLLKKASASGKESIAILSFVPCVV